jgi:hypothetical protein
MYQGIVQLYGPCQKEREEEKSRRRSFPLPLLTGRG